MKRLLAYVTPLAVVLALLLCLAPRASAQYPKHTTGEAPPATMGTVVADGEPSEHKAAAGAHATEHAEGEHAEGEHALGEINWVDFGNKKQPPLAIYLINLLILVGLIVKFGGPGIMASLVTRRDRVAKEIEEAQRMKKEAEQRAKKYQAKLEGLDEELDATKKSLVEAGVAEKERLVKEANEKAARMERDAGSLLEQEARQIRTDLVHETVELAIAAAEDLLRKRVTQADQERLAEDYLASFAKRGAPPSNLPPAGSTGGGSPSTSPAAAKSVGTSIPPYAQTGGNS
ncbi:MAG: synthase sector subunit b [Myxococcaceae bacterium]|jgi:F-type H+-transporting ATPase subunit b|nr:synthase sector subunit b [Myxococcaceae bacterium]